MPCSCAAVQLQDQRLTGAALGAAQIQPYLEGPVGMALYEWQDGKIGNVCVQGGAYPIPYPAACRDKVVTRGPSSTTVQHCQAVGAWRKAGACCLYGTTAFALAVRSLSGRLHLLTDK